ncbi:MAG: DHH family phosphoesterase [Kiloniellales bacterium]
MERAVAAQPGEALFGVERSFAGKCWRLRPADDRLALALAQRLDLPEVLGRILAARGVDLEAAADFLNPTLRAWLPDPGHLKDMDKAVARLVAAVTGAEPIAVFGDYDVDGATAAALLSRFLAAVGSEATVYIPDRRREGYGPKAPALRNLRRQGAALLITVDCGTTAHAALAAAAESGLDVIVVDHHAAEPRLPPAVAVINPNRLDESSPHRQLAAVGVALLLAVAVSRGCARPAGTATGRSRSSGTGWTWWRWARCATWCH